jgi:hypothetical protein
MTIVMAVGLDTAGELVSLYVGPAYSSATAALYNAGAEGRIIEGWVFNNPTAVLHQYYDRKSVPEPEEVRRKPRSTQAVH